MLRHEPGDKRDAILTISPTPDQSYANEIFKPNWHRPVIGRDAR